MSTVLTSQNKLKLLKICRKINPKRTQMLEVPEFIDPLSSDGTQLQDSDKDEILNKFIVKNGKIVSKNMWRLMNR